MAISLRSLMLWNSYLTIGRASVSFVPSQLLWRICQHSELHLNQNPTYAGMVLVEINRRAFNKLYAEI